MLTPLKRKPLKTQGSGQNRALAAAQIFDTARSNRKLVTLVLLVVFCSPFLGACPKCASIVDFAPKLRVGFFATVCNEEESRGWG